MPSSSDAVATSARSVPALEALLGMQALLLGQAAVMRGDMLLADALAQVARDALDHAPRVGEDQGGAVLLDQPRELVVEVFPDLVRHDRFERRIRQHQRQIARANVAAVDDDAVRCGIIRRVSALGGAWRRRPGIGPRLRSASASPTDRSAAAAGAHSAASRSSDSARCAPRLFGATRVDLIDDHRARVAGQHPPARLTGEQQVQRLGRGHEDVRRPAAHRGALGLRRIAGAHLRREWAAPAGPCAPARPRCLRAAARGCAGCRSTAP